MIKFQPMENYSLCQSCMKPCDKALKIVTDGGNTGTLVQLCDDCLRKLHIAIPFVVKENN